MLFEEQGKAYIQNSAGWYIGSISLKSFERKVRKLYGYTKKFLFVDFCNV